jgi:hypothetical protein
LISLPLKDSVGAMPLPGVQTVRFPLRFVKEMLDERIDQMRFL